MAEQLVEGTTELAGMIGSMISQNRKDREKKEAKRAAAKAYEAEEKARKIEEIAANKRGVTYWNSLGDDIDIKSLESLHHSLLELRQLQEARKKLNKITAYFEAKLYATPDPSEEKQKFYYRDWWGAFVLL